MGSGCRVGTLGMPSCADWTADVGFMEKAEEEYRLTIPVVELLISKTSKHNKSMCCIGKWASRPP